MGVMTDICKMLDCDIEVTVNFIDGEEATND